MRNKTIVVLVALIAILALAFAGITLGRSFGTDGVATSSPDGGAQPGARVSGTLRQIAADPPTLDPALSGDTDSAGFIIEIFSGLVGLSPKLVIEPELAERWDISPDGLTYTFHLRKGATFHDGKPVKAGDFKYSMERAADPKTESTTADSYLGDIIGVKDKLRGKATEISGVKVIDDSTLEIKIDAPKAYFLAKMSYTVSYVLDQANVESGKNWTAKPNGTGPFKLREWKKADKIVLERNDKYYRGPAKVQTLEYILAGGSAMTMYENNEIDVTGVGLNDIDRVLDKSNPLNRELVVSPSLSVGYVGFNVNMPPFDDVKVRQALNHAVDRDKIIKVVLKDLVQRADGVVPPGIPGFNENLKGLAFDPQKAKELIAQSKYGDVSKFPPVVISLPGTGAAVPPASEAVIEMWKTNLGLKVEIRQVEWATYLQDLKRKKFQAFELGWSADYPDPHDFVDLLFRTNSNENNTGYSNPQVDKILDAAQVEKDVQKRLKMYQEAEQIVVSDAAWLPLWFQRNYMVVKPYVKGFIVAPMIVPTMRFVSIEK